jgi:hypothetical protein
VKRLIPFGVSVLAVLLFSAASASAQGTGGFQFGLRGGISVPTGDWSTGLNNGWHGGLTLNYELPALPLGLRVDGDYNRFAYLSESRTVDVYDGNANLVVGIRIIAVKVYALAGGGYYSTSFNGFGSTTASAFGWNAGAGVALVVGKVSIFAEARYHEVSLDTVAGGKLKYIPVSAGILF